MELGLEGKVAFITGGAGGIGRAIARAFATEGCGVGLIDVDTNGLREARDELGAFPAPVATVHANLGSAAGVERGIADALDAFDGRVDILVNNVGICLARTFDDLDDEAWLHTLNLNFMGYVRAIRAVLPVLRARVGGCIINNASDLARQPEAGPPDYQAAKVAVLSLTKALALSEAPRIRVNAIAPGPIWTPLWTRPGGFGETLGKVHGMPPQEAVAHELSLRQLPLGRAGTADEVGRVFVFLASDAASYVTGSVWGVDGGSIRGLL